MRIVQVKRRALAQGCDFVEESHIARHVDFEPVVAVPMNDFLQRGRNVCRKFWVGEYLISFGDFCIAVSRPVAADTKNARRQDVIKANVVAANGYGSDIGDSWISPVNYRSQGMFPWVSLGELLTMHQSGCLPHRREDYELWLPSRQGFESQCLEQSIQLGPDRNTGLVCNPMWTSCLCLYRLHRSPQRQCSLS